MAQPVPDRAKQAAENGPPPCPVLQRIKDLLAGRNVPFDLTSHTESVRMKYADYPAVERSAMEVFSRPDPA